MPRAHFPPPSLLTLVSAELFVSFSLISPAAMAAMQQLFLLLKYVTTDVLSLLLMGLALASGGSILEPAGVGSVGHWGSF